MVETQRPGQRTFVAAAAEVGRGARSKESNAAGKSPRERADVGEVLLGDRLQQRLVELLGLLRRRRSRCARASSSRPR